MKERLVKFQRRMKGIIYNYRAETVVLCVFIVIVLFIGIIIMFYESNSIWFAMLVLCGYYGLWAVAVLNIVNEIYNWNANKSRQYLSCNRSFLRPKHVWINQRTIFWRNQEKCPQKEFVREMTHIRKELPKGTICYCRTHDIIVKHIKEVFPEAEFTEVYKKNLKGLKEKLKAKRCATCTYGDCSLMKDDETQFYAVKFII